VTLSRFFRDHRGTIWLVAATAILYALILFTGHRREIVPLAPQAQARMTSEDVEIREARFRKRLTEETAPMAVFSLSFLLILGGGALTNAWLLYRRSKGRKALGEGVPQENVPWGPAEIVQVFAVLFFTEACFVLLERAVTGLFNLPPTNKDVFILTNSLIRDTVVVFYVLWCVRSYGRKPDSIGLTLKNFGLNVKRGFVAYLAVVPFIFLTLLAVAAAAKFFSYKPAPQAVVDIYMRAPENKNLVVLTVFVAIIGPVIEEIFFRGFTYKAFRARVGPGWAMAASAAIFSLMHLNFVALVPIFLLGIYLAYLYEKTGSLVPSMTAHMAHNIVMVTFTLFFKAYSS
jgi:membrane protease YdiL (CAAX protease family)